MTACSGVLICGARRLDLSVPRVMGVLNATPDSFSDGGLYLSPASAVDRAAAMIDEGADIIDIGGESTRPGAAPVSPDEECGRVLPIVEALAGRFDVLLSVDTSAPLLMEESVRRGVSLLNDTRGFRREGALQAAVTSGAALCVMHMQGEPGSMQEGPRYDDVVADVRQWLGDRARVLVESGVSRDAILLDPGFGFGKSLDHNYRLLAGMPVLSGLGFPLLVGLSRKSMIGHVTGRPVQDRLAGSVAAALLAVQGGARIVRVHDVQATVDALRVMDMTQRCAAG